jgi:hypothetical protein
MGKTGGKSGSELGQNKVSFIEKINLAESLK